MQFGMSAPQLSEVYFEAVEAFVSNHQHLLNFRSEFMEGKAVLYADLIADKGSSLDSCFGVLDGTKIQMSRLEGPSIIQQMYYTGHKRFHFLLYLRFSTPDGLIF